MSVNFSSGTGLAVNVYLTNDADNALYARGTAANLPSATAGYATGCIYVTTDTGIQYSNNGSTSSCSFAPLASATISTTASLGTAQNSTPTVAQLFGGIVTQTSSTGAGTVTLPTGTVLDAAFPNVANGFSFTTRFANLGGGQTLTITAGASGITVVGTATVATATNIDLLFVRTGATTWICYTNK